ncbi:MAG TPA: DUF72 domain-containing protein [Dehalococcoidia bacterium]
MAQFRIGTSGWSYQHWRERFYPRGVPASRWLSYYAEHFDTVELNASFYRLPRESTWRGWAERAPEGFLFAVKASRLITHLQRLEGSQESVRALLDRARLLGPHLGPVLYQLPPGLQRDDARLAAFLEILPADVQHAFEFRHPSWFDEGVYALLRRFGAAFCMVDRGTFETPALATARFAYARFHGPQGWYGGDYDEGELREWAGRLRGLAAEVEAVYAYFNNDVNAFAVKNALRLRELLRGENP